MPIGRYGRWHGWLWGGLVLCTTLLAALVPGLAVTSKAEPRSPEKWVQVPFFRGTERFDLSRAGDLRLLSAKLKHELAGLRAKPKGHAEPGREAFREMSEPQLRACFSRLLEASSAKEERGFREMERLCSQALKAKTDPEREAALMWIAEIARALSNNARSPTPTSLDVLHFPFVFLDYARNPIARGDKHASNVPASRSNTADSNHPPDSSFWTRPRMIHSLDLYHGFGRTTIPDYQSPIWDYHGPKLSYGTSPGFEVSNGRQRLKVKFGETTSEPFAARIFSALGYNVEPADFVPALKIRYDRRLFREFHLRKELDTRVTALWTFKVWTIHLQRRRDPFNYIAAAVMKDGTRIDGREFKSRLLRNPERDWAESDPLNFREDVENQIDHLVTVPTNVQLDDPNCRSIGPWEFEGLGHEHRRELRGVGLLAAWLGWCDSRFENTRLKVVNAPNGRELKHFFTDLGGGLGKAIGPISRHCESPNEFAWTFTQAEKVRGRGRMTTPFRIVGYEPIEDTQAFKEMTVDDARWMARWIGQLSERQIVEALVASGFDSAHVRLYTEKLISRRDQMIRDLGLGSDIALLRPNGTNRRFDFDPRSQGSVRVEVQGRGMVDAPIGNAAVRAGEVQVIPQRTNDLIAFR